MLGMTEPTLSPREIAAARLRARAERLRVIRRRVFATALATFAIAFGVIGATGSMGQSSNATSLATSGSVSSSSSSGTTSSGSDDSSGTTAVDPFGDSSSGSSSSSNSQQSAGAPMTTQQS
jgi:hypothetical protein